MLVVRVVSFDDQLWGLHWNNMTKVRVLLDCVLVLVLWLLGDCFEECFSLVLFILIVDFIFVNKSLTCHGFNLQLWFLNANTPVKINLYDSSLECYQIYWAFSIAPCYVWCSLKISRYISISTWHIFLFVMSLISNPKRLVWNFFKPSLQWLSTLDWMCNFFSPIYPPFSLTFLWGFACLSMLSQMFHFYFPLFVFLSLFYQI